MLPLKRNLLRSVAKKTSHSQKSSGHIFSHSKQFLRMGLFATVCFGLTACETEATKSSNIQFEDAPEIVNAVAYHQEDDPMTLVIGAERWGVMISNAHEAMQLKHPETRDDDLLRIDQALRAGVRDLLHLRDALCLANEQPMQSCVRIDIPAWVMNPPNRVTSLAEYSRRSDWLGETMNDLTSIGCQAGRAVSEDEFLCAVE